MLTSAKRTIGLANINAGTYPDRLSVTVHTVMH